MGQSSESGQVTRRSVVRAAAHSAWAVPVVVAASAAPALAASAGPVVMTEVQTARTVTTVVVDSRFRNQGTGDATGLRATVRMTPTVGTVVDVAKINDSPGWVQDAPATVTGGVLTASFTYASPVAPGTQTALELYVTVTTVGGGMNGGLSSGTVQSTPTITTGTAAVGAGSWT